MKVCVPHSELTFTNGDSACSHSINNCFEVKTDHYAFKTDLSVLLVQLSEVETPVREHNLIWFRDDETVKSILTAMCQRKELPAIEVWSKGLRLKDRYVIRDGFHRFHLSVSLGFNRIPVKVNDWDFETPNE